MNAHYFALETNLPDDDRVMIMMEETGIAGFGAYMMLLVQLRKKEGYRCNIRNLKVIARMNMIPMEVLEKVVYNYNLFEFTSEEEETFLSSPYMDKVMAALEEKRAQASRGGKKRASTAERAANGRFTSFVQLKEKRREYLLSTTLSSSGEVEKKKEEVAVTEKVKTKKTVTEKVAAEETTKPHTALAHETPTAARETPNVKSSVTRHTAKSAWKTIREHVATEDKKQPNAKVRCVRNKRTRPVCREAIARSRL